ncbi:PucR family transcriptional regulator [Nocardia brasiliensis]|uniref:Uncharacterized protein n=1 Tax=Nocardia brasiliensis (strain ATCC 700358 / HUJEG-1) TaxID=1133849 RepID=K0F3I9_NOCB7|nr:helix-turn-helix domain-containing protein [Nocardia brasiliensis]AFU04099.1 hypothetical protein O3I_030750 [Nocardia brasiliensis ATCC 700358]OCF91267.1 hypothetical protein AW168_05630 [Nocardia brasiliensis]
MSGVRTATAKRRLVTELAARESKLLDRIVGTARSEIPAYARLGPDMLRPLTARMIESMLLAMVEERGPSGTELRAFHEFGVIRAGQGIALAEMLGAWRLAVRVILDEMGEIGRSHQVSGLVQLELTRQLLDIVDVAILELTGGHREVELANAGRDHQARADFTRAALTGTLTRAEIGLRAQQYSLDLEHAAIPFRARPTAEHGPAELPQLFTRSGRIGFVTTIDGDLAGFIDRLPDALPVPTGFGPATPIDQLPTGFIQATRALNTAAAFALSGAHSVADLGLLPAVLADTEVGDHLVHRYLDPLHRTDSPDLYRQTLHTYLESGLHIETTARELVVHPNTVRYRIDRYQTLTGHDLRKPTTTLELWWALRRHHLRTTTL